MPARSAYAIVSVLFVFSLAQAIACAQGQDPLDISLPSSYMINATKAYVSSDNYVDIWSPIEIFKSDGNVYVSIPTNAPTGTKLAFFQDMDTRALFRNNTLALSIDDGQGRIANLVLMTGDPVCDNGKFYGQVTGIELDTKAVGDGDTMASAVLYLNKWPDKAAYQVSLSEDEQVKKAVRAEAANNGQAGIVKLMLDVRGASEEAQGSIGYVIVRMRSEEAEGNVSAYLYHGDAVSWLTCKEIKSNDGIVYETISSGAGTFAFVGPFSETPANIPGIIDVLLFIGAVAALQLGLIAAAVIVIRKAAELK